MATAAEHSRRYCAGPDDEIANWSFPHAEPDTLGNGRRNCEIDIDMEWGPTRSRRPHRRSSQSSRLVTRRRPCPLWVISGHRGTSEHCPLCPRKRTFAGAPSMPLCLISAPYPSSKVVTPYTRSSASCRIGPEYIRAVSNTGVNPCAVASAKASLFGCGHR